MSTAVILGGGISGLSAAYYLQKVAASKQIGKIILLESSSRLGGWINSTRYEDGAVFESGARSLRPVGKPGLNTLKLIEELNLDNQILPLSKKDAAAKNRYIYTKKKLIALPSTLMGLIKRQDPFTKPLIGQFVTEPFKKRVDTDDETIHDFISRRINKEFADIVGDCICRGVFAGDSRILSMKSCIPIIYDVEKKYGSVVLGSLKAARAAKAARARENPTEYSKSKLIHRSTVERWASYSFNYGLQQLPEALEEVCKSNTSVDIHINSPVKELKILSNGQMSVTTDLEQIQADHVFSAIYSKNLSKILNDDNKYLKSHLDAISAVSCAIVNIEYEGYVLPVQGFGHLIPSTDSGPILGITYDSCCFPLHDRKDKERTTRITVMMGGAWSNELRPKGIWMSDEDLITMAIEAASDQLNISEKPIRMQISILNNCIPQYELRHDVTVSHMNTFIKERNLPLHLIGSSYKGVSINDCILNAKIAVENI